MVSSPQTLFETIMEEEDYFPNFDRRPSIPKEDEGMELKNVSIQRIQEAGILDLYRLSQMAGIQDDDKLTETEDLRERLILIKRKLEGSSHTWKHMFTIVRKENDTKIYSLVDLMETLEESFKTIPVDSLSELLMREEHLRQPDLLQELSVRIKNLIERKSLVVVAGETNGGKSTFLNLLLGEDILPTDILHCTFAICKIVYSESYNIKTVDHNGVKEEFACSVLEEARAILKAKVSQQEMRERMQGSPIKEITLGLPASILKSGVTLVDTPGIGEDEQMDSVTMNFVKSTHASAFIYIIKSDTAGGVQEDRLLGFLRAIKEKYQSGTMMEAFDPRAAMFVCHRWDNIEEAEREKVKKNALTRLEYVWPGFDASQTFFFSTKNTLKHLPVDPAFVTDSFFELLKGLKLLFDRATYNAIKLHYIWLKYMLPPASRHLRSMITFCIRSNEELEKYFQSIAEKQEKLMAASKENSIKLQSTLDDLSNQLCYEVVSKFLNFDTISVKMEINEFEELRDVCSKENFLKQRDNRHRLDEMIIHNLLKYTDEQVHSRDLVYDMEFQMLQAIQEHLGLFKSQIRQIKHNMLHGGNLAISPSQSMRSLDIEDHHSMFASSTASTASSDSSIQGFEDDVAIDPSRLAVTVKSLLLKKKYEKNRAKILFHGKHEMRQSVFGKLRDKIVFGLGNVDIESFLEDRVRKVARNMREDKGIVDSIIKSYTEWIQAYVDYARKSIPRFLDVNTNLMDVIREHRGVFQRDKDLLIKVMEDLEPNRHHLRGYGELYMADINAEMLAFNIEHRTSSVQLPRDIVVSHRMNDDSGFQGSSSKKRKVQSLWCRMQGANIQVDEQRERVVVKTYIYDMDEKVVLSEIATLRCLDDLNIASFFGMTRIVTESSRGDTIPSTNINAPGEKVSAFIFRGDLISARVHSHRRFTNMQLFVPEFIMGLLKGLNYIHREKLVHMELNLDTVMVDKANGTVKLCQMCKPREARFPVNLDMLTKNCVCLSPSVLQGHVYELTDDMYAFGLLLWELLFPKEPPYQEQKTWQLGRFIKECHPFNMLKEGIMNLQVTNHVKDVLKGTLLVSRGNVCIPIAKVQSLLVKLPEEPAVRHLKSRTPSNLQRMTQTSAPEVEITSSSGKAVRFPENLEDSLFPMPTEERPPSSPVRPYRKKDVFKLNKFKSEESHPSLDMQSKGSQLAVPEQVRKDRRNTEPALSVSHLAKKKSSFSIFKLFKNKNKLPADQEKLEHSDNSEDLNRSARGKQEFRKEKGTSNVIVAKHADKELSLMTSSQGRSHGRRLSLDHFSSSAKSPSIDETSSFDVPELLVNEQFLKPESFANSWSKAHQQIWRQGDLSPLKSASSTSSLPCLANSEKTFSESHTPDVFYSVSSNNVFSRKYRRPGEDYRSPHRSKKHLSLGSHLLEASLQSRSLQNLSDGSVNHVNHAMHPILEAEMSSSYNEQDRRSLSSLKSSLKSTSRQSSQVDDQEAGTNNSSSGWGFQKQRISSETTMMDFNSFSGNSLGGDSLIHTAWSQNYSSDFDTRSSGSGVKRPSDFPRDVQTHTAEKPFLLHDKTHLIRNDKKHLIHHSKSNSDPVDSDHYLKVQSENMFLNGAQSTDILLNSSREDDSDDEMYQVRREVASEDSTTTSGRSQKTEPLNLPPPPPPINFSQLTFSTANDSSGDEGFTGFN